MAVFGIPISVQTVRGTGDLVDYTMKMINAGEKDTNAQKFVDNLKDSYGIGISTKCLIYNATGTTLTFVTSKDWHGHIYDTYPGVIQNGQWGAYLHVHSALPVPPAGSAGAVVYRSSIPDTSPCDLMFSWSIPLIGDNSVYTEIRAEGHFPHYWDYIYHKCLEKSGQSDTYKDYDYGYVSETDIGEGYTVNARAIFRRLYYCEN